MVFRLWKCSPVSTFEEWQKNTSFGASGFVKKEKRGVQELNAVQKTTALTQRCSILPCATIRRIPCSDTYDFLPVLEQATVTRSLTMKRFLPLLMLFSLLLAVPTGAEAGKLKLDKVHSSVRFQLRHFFTKFQGGFDRFDAKFEFDAKKIKATKLSATVFVNSVNTNNKKRDGHLVAPDYFDGKKYAKMTFKSTKVTKVQGKTFWLAGKLTIRGTTKNVTFKVKFLGEMKKKDRWGNIRSGFQATATINRVAFGVGSKSLALGSKVKIILNVEMLRR
jgi:polyisoprenoid-binding protein YceI